MVLEQLMDDVFTDEDFETLCDELVVADFEKRTIVLHNVSKVLEALTATQQEQAGQAH